MYYDLSYSVCETKLFFFSGILIISRLEKGELAYVSESSKRQLKGKITRATISNVFWG